jgi:hypothetical protein
MKLNKPTPTFGHIYRITDRLNQPVVVESVAEKIQRALKKNSVLHSDISQDTPPAAHIFTGPDRDDFYKYCYNQINVDTFVSTRPSDTVTEVKINHNGTLSLYGAPAESTEAFVPNKRWVNVTKEINDWQDIRQKTISNIDQIFNEELLKLTKQDITKIDVFISSWQALIERFT